MRRRRAIRAVLAEMREHFLPYLLQPYFVIRMILGLALMGLVFGVAMILDVEFPWWSGWIFYFAGQRLVHGPLERIQPAPTRPDEIHAERHA